MYVLIVPYPAPNVKQASLRVSILRCPHVRRRAKIAPYNLYSHSARNMRKAADPPSGKRNQRPSRAKETPRPALGLHVVVELELLAVAAVPAAMPLSWESIGRWFASFGGVDRYQPGQGRNRKTGFWRRHVADRGDGLVLIVDGSDGRSSRSNCRRARRPDDFGSSRALSTVVRASGCASPLLCILLYGVDAEVPSHQDGSAP